MGDQNVFVCVYVLCIHILFQKGSYKLKMVNFASRRTIFIEKFRFNCILSIRESMVADRQTLVLKLFYWYASSPEWKKLLIIDDFSSTFIFQIHNICTETEVCISINWTPVYWDRNRWADAFKSILLIFRALWLFLCSGMRIHVK